MKIVLGTVQFGVNYGINNAAGQVPFSEVCEVFRIAHKNGIKTLDTSSAYGKSEKVLGKALKETNLKEEFYKLKYCSTVVYMVPRA